MVDAWRKREGEELRITMRRVRLDHASRSVYVVQCVFRSVREKTFRVLGDAHPGCGAKHSIKSLGTHLRKTTSSCVDLFFMLTQFQCDLFFLCGIGWRMLHNSGFKRVTEKVAD